MRSRTATFIAILLLSFPATLPAQTDALQFDFEEDEIGNVPQGWLVPQSVTAGYNVEVKARNAAEGEQYVRLSSKRDLRGSPFGNIMQFMNAAPFHGKVVRLRAAVRADVSGHNRAQLWFRVDRPNQEMGFFDNMGDRPITADAWKHYEIVGRVDEDAVRINFGLVLYKEGSADLDDVSIEIVSKSEVPECEPPRPLEGRALKNLVAFARLLGYVRYFHPSDEAADADGEAFAIEGIREAESPKSANKLASRLEKLFRPIAPTVRVFRTGRQPATPKELKRPKNKGVLRIRRWEHQGLGQGDDGQNIYKSKRTRRRLRKGRLPKGYPDPADPFIANLGGGVSCMIPLALYADEKGTLPRAESVDEHGADNGSAHRASLYSANDRATRLADVALAWNVFQHFYPYFDVVATDWDAALPIALKKAAKDNGERAFLDTLREMVAQLHDGHGNVWHLSYRFNAILPVNWTWVENRLVVTQVANAVADGPKVGDVVESINGRPVAEHVARLERLISGATPQWIRWKILRRLSAGKAGEAVELKVRRPDDRERTLTLRRAIRQEPLQEPRPKKIQEIKTGIYYVDIGRISDADFSQALPDIKAARGIVFDFRGYPSNISPQTLFSHIIKSPVTSPQWHVPVIHRPDREGMTFTRAGEWHLRPSAPYLKAPKAFIIDSRAISYAESCLGIIEHYKLGELVGEPTAGTNGNINPFTLPGGYHIVWTGMKVLKHDGSQHHGVGILPTTPVSRTIKGIVEGRDELLERAVAIVSRAS